ncbi:MAG: hypothetical protein SFV15_08280 [Polyangiaceae bacterium]|nr:hypothetical protein [Polyangiaceae bacterium]
MRFEIDAAALPLRMPWKKGITVGRAYELLREDLLGHLRKAQAEIGFKYCRFHGLFHDDMAVVHRKPDGTIVYQWHHVDKVFDALLAMGLKPFVELNPMPSALASGTQKMFFYQMNVTPPKDYKEWEELNYEFAAHCAARYGIDEVRSWYFEVWNEPNLGGFWSGTQAEYFELYRAAAHGIRRVDPGLRVGGPASSKASWISDFIDYCSKNEVPIDFVSTHLYPQDEYVEFPEPGTSPHAPGTFFRHTVRRTQVEIEASVYPELEVHWTEWNAMSADSGASVHWLDNPTNDNLYAASFIAENCLALDDAADSFFFWVVSDVFEEAGFPLSPFSCTYGLLTVHGIPKASYNAFRLLSRLRGSRMEPVEGTKLGTGHTLVATREASATHVLLCNHKPLEVAQQPELKETVSVPAHGPGEHVVVLERIRVGSGSAWETWVRMGRPQEISIAQERLLRQHAEPEMSCLKLPAREGSVSFDVVVGPNEVVYAEVRALGASSVGKGSGAAESALWDKLMGEKSR